MLSGDVSLCSVFELVSLLCFLHHDTSDFVSNGCDAAFLLRCEGKQHAKRWEELSVTRMQIISDTFIQCVLVNTLIFTLAVFLTFPHAHARTHTLLFHTWTTPHLYTILLTAWEGADGLDIWSWLTRRENEGELHIEEKRRKKEAESGRERKV